MTNTINVTIAKVEKIGKQTRVMYENYGSLGCCHPDFHTAKEGQIYKLNIDTNELIGGTKLISAELIHDPVWL